MKPLTKRESEVLHWFAENYTYEQTAEMMGISISTVKSHATALSQKMQAIGRVSIVWEAHKNGLVV